MENDKKQTSHMKDTFFKDLNDSRDKNNMKNENHDLNENLNKSDNQTDEIKKAQKNDDLLLNEVKEKFAAIQTKFQEKIENLENENDKLLKKLMTFKASHEKVKNLAQMQEYLQRLIKKMEEKVKYANSSLALKILTPIDWLEHTVESSTKHSDTQDNEKPNPWLKGLEFIIKDLHKSLEKEGITPIDIKIGDAFDPEIAEVIDQKNDNKFKKDQIIEIIKKGYKLHERILRHAKVIVAE